MTAVLLSEAAAVLAGWLSSAPRYGPAPSPPHSRADLTGPAGASPEVGLEPTHTQLHRIFSPVKLGGLELKNRIVRAAAFGGADIDTLIECHAEIARGGAAMTTVAYAAVCADVAEPQRSSSSAEPAELAPARRGTAASSPANRS